MAICKIIGKLLTKHITGKNNNTLDLGCGTGLCCKYLRNFSSIITGVDLSSKMIEKSRSLNCYDNLIIGEITEFVNESDNIFDLIIAADVFVYIGSLRNIINACSNKISNGGYLIFSTEYLPNDASDDFRLFDSGRHKHSINYVNTVASEFGFEVVEHQFSVLRQENGKDVEGNISVLMKT